MYGAGVVVHTLSRVDAVMDGAVVVRHTYSGQLTVIDEVGSIVVETGTASDDSLVTALSGLVDIRAIE